MKPGQYFKEIEHIAKSDPIRDLADTLYSAGITENQLNQWHKLPDARELPDPIKIKVQNSLRDIYMGTRPAPKAKAKVKKVPIAKAIVQDPYLKMLTERD